MEALFNLEVIINIITALMIGGCVVEMYVGLTMTENWKSFVFYTVALVLGIVSFIYNMGRVVCYYGCIRY